MSRATETGLLKLIVVAAFVAALFVPVVARAQLVPFPGPLPTPSASGGSSGGGGGGTITGGGASPQVAFWSGATAITGDAGFTYSTAAGVVINEAAAAAIDFRAETATDVNGIFLDASAETIDLVGGSGSTGCSISSTGLLTCAGAMNALGGDAAATPNFFVDTGEGMYDGGSDILAFASAGVELITLTATQIVFNETSLDRDFRVESDTDVNFLYGDASTGRWGMGTSTPNAELQIAHDYNGATYINVTNASDTAAAQTQLALTADTAPDTRQVVFAAVPTSGTAFGTFASGNGILGTGGNGSNSMDLIIGSRSNNNRFTIIANPSNATGEYTTASENARFNAAAGAVFNENGETLMDFRVESDGNINAIFIDSSAETMLLMGGSASTGCSIDASGNFTCAGTINGTGGSYLPLAGGTMTGTITFNGVTTDITASSGQDLTLVGGATTGSIAFQAPDNQIDVFDSAGNVEGRIVTASGDVNMLVVGGSSFGTGGAVKLTSAIGVFGAQTNRAATSSAGCFADEINATGGSTNLMCMFGSGKLTIEARQSAACAAGVLALDPTSSVVYLDANGAGCVVTIGEASANVGSDITIVVTTSAGAGVVTFPDVANVHDGPTLCTTTGITQNSSYTIHYADAADDLYVGKACEVN